MDVYAIVTERIIEGLNNGVVAWHKPWTTLAPQNAVSKRPYRGINTFLLALEDKPDNRWLTFRQVEQLGGMVKKGTKSAIVTFWKFPKEDDLNAHPIFRYYRVHNVSDTNLVEIGKLPTLVVSANKPNVDVNAVFDNMPNPPKFQEAVGGAWYSPLTDVVSLPPFNTFDSTEAHTAVRAHEYVHSTGHKTRCDRNLSMMKEDYSKEELVAEIGAAMLCAAMGVEVRYEQSTAYIAAWLEVLRNDQRFVVTAASAAQKAVDYILGVSKEEE